MRKLDHLRSILRDMGSALVCYSGGIDSAFLLAVAHAELGERAVGMTAVSPSLPASERGDAARVAKKLGARHLLVETHELDRPDYAKNDSDRCFHCKSELYEVAHRERLALGLAHVVNGTNSDDLGDYRPGLEAARRAGARSPLVEAQMTKSDVRVAAQLIGLDTWDKPASACLSSRIPYGTSVTRERLAQIEGFEAELRVLGFRQLRVRWHDKIARVELAVEELQRAVTPGTREAIVAAGKHHGFTYVALDLGGYRVGSHNEVLIGEALKVVD
jgi:uncharacterized protein